jgi:hypothetical protein
MSTTGAMQRKRYAMWPKWVLRFVPIKFRLLMLITHETKNGSAGSAMVLVAPKPQKRTPPEYSVSSGAT